MAETNERMAFLDARNLNIVEATDEQLVAAWHAYAGQISFHRADDSGKEWGLASALMQTARTIETRIRDRGLERPTGSYLMSLGDRIDWETGLWERGWDWKKRQAERGVQA